MVLYYNLKALGAGVHYTIHVYAYYLQCTEGPPLHVYWKFVQDLATWSSAIEIADYPPDTLTHP